MKTKIQSYSFNKATKQVTFSDYSTIYLDKILLIVNVTANIIIYNFSDSTKGGTVATNVLTLTYDTSSMNNTDKLLIYYDDAVGHNPVITNTWTSGLLTSQSMVIEGVTYTRTLTWSSGQLTAISAWS